jgi:hypothetical protein
MNTTTLTAMIAYVSWGSALSVRAVRTWVFCLEHSGQRMPTGVGVMQSGQIGRPQLEQCTAVSRRGCR